MERQDDARDERPVPTVRVEGEGSVDVVPDAATVTLGVIVTAYTLPAAREQAAARAAAIIAANQEAGVPAHDIQTSAYRIQPIRDDASKGDPTLTRGYEVRNTVTVTVRDLDRLPAVLDTAAAAGANQVQGPDFFIQHPEEAEDDARRLAMASARRRAEILAVAAGASLGRVCSIADGGAHGSPVPRMALREMAPAAHATPIETGTERITARVEVVWELA
jgi:uncharacterized protein YggE